MKNVPFGGCPLRLQELSPYARLGDWHLEDAVENQSVEVVLALSRE